MIKIGVDIIQIPRIQTTFLRFGDTFIKKLLSNEEKKEFFNLDYTQSTKITYLAKKFSSKEAIVKAFGVGFGKYLNFTDITISHDKMGAPVVNVKDTCVKRIFPDYTNINVSLSISDDYPTVIAFAILEVH